MRISLATLLFWIASAAAFEFTVGRGDERCFWQSLESDALVVGKFSKVSAVGAAARVYVQSPAAHLLFDKQAANDGQFSFTAVLPGRHAVCFDNGSPQPLEYSLDVKTGLEANDDEAAANADAMLPLQAELATLEGRTRALLVDMSRQRDQEEAMRQTNESTSTTVLLFSFLTIALVVVVAGSQIWLLYSHFKSTWKLQ